MKPEQFSQYKQISEEIQPVKKFLETCGIRHHGRGRIKARFKLVCRRLDVALYRIWHLGSVEDNLFIDIPQDLQDRIVEVVEQWVNEKEEELSKI